MWVIGSSQAAPYRHFRDRTAIVAEVARRGFEQLGAELGAARQSARTNPVVALERCAQAHLAFAAHDAAAYAAMFENGFPAAEHPELMRAREAAFAVVRQAAQAACDRSRAPRQPPALMGALHVWSLTHGIADLCVRHGDGNGRALLPMSPDELLEAGLLVYLRSLQVLVDEFGWQPNPNAASSSAGLLVHPPSEQRRTFTASCSSRHGTKRRCLSNGHSHSAR